MTVNRSGRSVAAPLTGIDVLKPDPHHQNMKRFPNTFALAATLTMLACASGQADSSQVSKTAAELSVSSKPEVVFDGRVTDAAHLLSLDTRARLSAKLERFENVTQHQMVVVTVKSLGGRDVADFTKDLANAWGIGRKGYNDGVVFLVAPNERKVRIAVGYGLEGVLTKPICQQIIDTAILPAFRGGDFSGGIEGGTDALIARLT